MAILAGFFLDFCFGDPHGMPHPVRVVGTLIGTLDKWFLRWAGKEKKKEEAGGFFLVLCTLALTGGACLLILTAASAAGPVWLFAAETVMCYFLLAARSLRDESMAVYRNLKKEDVEAARFCVSMIVGRDTKPLSRTGIVKAAVETVAENTSDGVIAPLFYLALGGPVLGWIYKAVNTMDSMVGYKNETYFYFGKAAARLDDFANFLPSRLCAALMIVSSFFLRMNFKNAVRIYRRDRLRHQSPNSAQTEAVCAGALEIQLAGDAWYFGKLHEKPTIGDPMRPVEAQDIVRANRLMYMTAILSLAAISAALCFVFR